MRTALSGGRPEGQPLPRGLPPRRIRTRGDNGPQGTVPSPAQPSPRVPPELQADCPLTGDEPPLPLVDQEVGDDRRVRRPQPTSRLIPPVQRLKLLAACRGGQQGLQFFLPLLERFRRGHPRPFRDADWFPLAPLTASWGACRA